jgi:predicted CXXCH cytochrome family protein
MRTGNKKIFYLIMLAGTIITLMHCTTTKKQKVLSFFFDGVPDSTALANYHATIIRKQSVSEKPDSASEKLAAGKYFLHKPYLDHQCGKCHDTSSMGHFIKPKTELCLDCHEKYEKKFAFVHGPVASGYCAECHDPHMSVNKNLLTRVNENICFSCHNKQDIMLNKKHQGMNTNDCLSCHNAHGGKNHYMEN